MSRLVLALVWALSVTVLWPSGSVQAQSGPDQRMKIDFPPDALAYFRANMHKRMTDLDTVIALVSQSKTREAAAVLKEGLAQHGHHAPDAPRPGRFVPPEFRALDMSFHGLADDLASVLSKAAVPPSAADYAAIFKAMAAVTATCSGCHASYRIH